MSKDMLFFSMPKLHPYLKMRILKITEHRAVIVAKRYSYHIDLPPFPRISNFAQPFQHVSCIE